MSGILVIPANASLIEELVNRIPPGEESRALVVFPGKRPAHFLRRALAHRAGKAFIPPHAFSLEGFVEYVYAVRMGNRARAIDATDGAALLYVLHKRLSNPIGGEHFDSIAGFLPLGLKLFSELEDLAMADVSRGSLERVLENVGLGPLAELYESLYTMIRDKGYVTRALKYQSVCDGLERIQFGEFSHILLAGFFSPLPAETRLIKHLLQRENALLIVHDGRDLDEGLKAIGLPFSRPSQRAAKEPDIRFIGSPDTHGQLFALNAILSETQNDAADPESTVIALPSAETLFPLIQQTLAPMDETAYNISLGYPLSRTPLYGFFSSLVRLIDSMHDGKLFAPDYFRFVLHPFTKNIRMDGRADATRVLFNTLEEEFLRSRALTFFRLQDVEGDGAFFERVVKRLEGMEIHVTSESIRDHLVKVHAETFGRCLVFQNLGDCALQVARVVRFIAEESTAPLHAFFTPFADAVLEALETFAASMTAENTCASLSEYFRVIDAHVADVSVPFSGTPLHGLQALGVLETRNLRFKRVCILDANDDVLPGGGSATILPARIREELGLSNPRSRERTAAYHFDVLIAGAHEVNMFHHNGGEKERSRFIERLMWERQQRESEKDASRYVRQVVYTVALDTPVPRGVRKSKDELALLSRFSFSATALDTYLRCPLRFYYQHILRLSVREDLGGEVEASDIGSFVHGILSSYFGPRMARPLREESLDPDQMDRLVEKRFEEEFGRNPVGAQYLIKRQLKQRLRDFLLYHQRPLAAREEVTIVGLEQKLEAEKGGIAFRGFADRIERRGNRLWILDYKTGGKEQYNIVNFEKLQGRETWEKAIGSLQLPLYMLLYSSSQGESLENIVPAFLFLGKPRVDQGMEIPLFNDSLEPRSAYAILEDVIFSLVAEIKDPDREFSPTRDLENECPGCSFVTLCGTRWIQSHTGA